VSLSQSIFKAYDIRGIVADELTPDVVKLIGQAIGSESIAKGERGVVIGRDGQQKNCFIVLLNSICCHYSHYLQVGYWARLYILSMKQGKLS
jgi:hypothetical protein